MKVLFKKDFLKFKKGTQLEIKENDIIAKIYWLNRLDEAKFDNSIELIKEKHEETQNMVQSKVSKSKNYKKK